MQFHIRCVVLGCTIVLRVVSIKHPYVTDPVVSNSSLGKIANVVVLNEKAQKVANAMRKDHCIIQLESLGAAVSPQQIQGRTLVGSRGTKPSKAPRSLHFM